MADTPRTKSSKTSKKSSSKQRTSKIVNKSTAEEIEFEQVPEKLIESEIDTDIYEEDLTYNGTFEVTPEELEAQESELSIDDQVTAKIQEVYPEVEHVLTDEPITRISFQSVKHAFKNAYPDAAGVDEVQQALKEDGFYSGPVNGNVTNTTRKAFAAYQRSIKKQPTGIPTVDELEALGFEVVA